MPGKLKDDGEQNAFQAFVYTEGKTDWKYLEKAKQKLNVKLDLHFYKKEDFSGDRDILELCKSLSRSIYPQEKPLIFVFDRDNPQLVKEVEEKGSDFKHWGNNVFSFAIPLPSHRTGYENLSIEFYFSDTEIITNDSEGRRLFLSSEFIESSGRHVRDHTISYGNRHKLKGITEPRKTKIIDSDVFDQNSRSIALSKSDFSDNIYNDTTPFDKFDFSEFKSIFFIIEAILKESQIENNLAEEDTKTLTIRHVPDEDRVYKDSPPVVSIFVGRDREIKQLSSPQIRVAAITGLGGEGKSTLAAVVFKMAMGGESKRQYTHFGWCDCKDLETTFHQKLLGLLEDLTEGEDSKERYSDENVKNTIRRFTYILNKKNCLIVFDNVDAFVDKEACVFTGHVKALFDHLTRSLSNSLVVFTCRAQINDYHFSFLEVPIAGLSYGESLELAQNFGILGSKVSEANLRHIHTATKGHALWLNLIFAQIRNERLTTITLDTILETESKILDRHLLRSIWSNLSNNERELVWTISTFTRPPNIDRIIKATGMTYQKCSRLIRSLVRLRMLIEISADKTILYDLHPIIRMKAKEECKPEKKKSLLEKIIIILSFNNWGRLEAIVTSNESYTADLDRYVECAEIALENQDFPKAVDYVAKVSDGLLKYGEDAKFIELATELLQIAPADKFQIGIHPTLSSIYEDLIKVFLNQGEFEKVNAYLTSLNNGSLTIQEYIFYSEQMGYSLWFQNHFHRAIEFLETAVQQIKSKGERVPSGMEYDYALALRDSGRVDEALEYFLSKTDLKTINSWDPDSGRNLAADTGNVSRCYYLKGLLDESLNLCKKSAQYLKKGHTRQDRINYGYALLWVADIYVKQRNFVEAKGYLDEALNVWKRYCPSRIDKIRDHIQKYPKETKKTLPEYFFAKDS